MYYCCYIFIYIMFKCCYYSYSQLYSSVCGNVMALHRVTVHTGVYRLRRYTQMLFWGTSFDFTSIRILALNPLRGLQRKKGWEQIVKTNRKISAPKIRGGKPTTIYLSHCRFLCPTSQSAGLLIGTTNRLSPAHIWSAKYPSRRALFETPGKRPHTWICRKFTDTPLPHLSHCRFFFLRNLINVQ